MKSLGVYMISFSNMPQNMKSLLQTALGAFGKWGDEPATSTEPVPVADDVAGLGEKEGLSMSGFFEPLLHKAAYDPVHLTAEECKQIQNLTLNHFHMPEGETMVQERGALLDALRLTACLVSADLDVGGHTGQKDFKSVNAFLKRKSVVGVEAHRLLSRLEENAPTVSVAAGLFAQDMERAAEAVYSLDTDWAQLIVEYRNKVNRLSGGMKILRSNILQKVTEPYLKGALSKITFRQIPPSEDPVPSPRSVFAQGGTEQYKTRPTGWSNRCGQQL